jgi:hypothetical protein
VSSPPAGWHRDPIGRFEQRFWDGSQWTPRIRNGMSEGADPMGANYTTMPQHAAPPQAAYGAYVVPQAPRVSGLAIASMVLGIIWFYWIGSVLALIFGFIALAQIRRSNGWRTGRGMAIAGVVLGFVGMAVLALIVVIAVVSPGGESRSRFESDPYDGVCNDERFLQDPDC